MWIVKKQNKIKIAAYVISTTQHKYEKQISSTAIIKTWKMVQIKIVRKTGHEETSLYITDE